MHPDGRGLVSGAWVIACVAAHNGGAVERNGIFHLPGLFVMCEGQFHGQLQVRLYSL
nr:hypothetical protein [Pseudomonas karstica]